VTGIIRIIGGKWRSRQIKVIAHPGLRPTPDRVRETVFNWLTGRIQNARCLDLFAGSGALGFEALSRGAKSVTFVEKYVSVVKAIHQSAASLEALNACEIVLGDGLRWLRQHFHLEAFDVIFLDPPFAADLLPKCFTLLSEGGFVKPNTLIYIEAPKPLTAKKLPDSWQILKQSTAGEVVFHLVEVGEA